MKVRTALEEPGIAWILLLAATACGLHAISHPRALAGQQAASGALDPDPTWSAPEDRYHSTAYRLHSSILDEDRRILVALPPSHVRTTRQYPLVIVLDGEAIFGTVVAAMSALEQAGHAPEAVIVGVVNTDRLRDLSPPGLPVSGNGGLGAADRFAAFLEEEMRPALAHQVRAGGPVYLVGHSSGGLFAHYAAATRPDVFGSVLSLDAPMHLPGAAEMFSGAATSASLHVVGLESRFGWPDEDWGALMAEAPPRWTLVRQGMEDESHQTMVWPGSYLGLKKLFADFSTVGFTGEPSIDRLRGFDERRIGGGEIPPSQSLLREAVEDRLIAREIDEATATLERLVDAYGESPSAADLRRQIEEASRDDLDGPPVADLLAAPAPPAESVLPLVGRWRGFTESAGVRRPIELTFGIENGAPVGEITPAQGPPHPLDYVGVAGEEIHVGYMNGVRPRGLLMYEGRVGDGVFEGLFVLRGVVFELPGGRELPITRFRLERVSGGDG